MKITNIGHRARVKEKFLTSFGEELHDYELLEILLFSAIPRKDCKPLAKKLIAKFGDISSVINADENLLREVEEVGNAVIVQIKLIAQIYKRIFRKPISKKPILNNFPALISYISLLLKNLQYEAFYALFLDDKNCLIAEKLLAKGENNFVLVNAKDVARCALINHASAVILVHNHPNCNLKPSNSDIKTTTEIGKILQKLQIKLIDHIIIAGEEYFSFQKELLL